MQLSGDEFMAKFSPLGLPMRILKGFFELMKLTTSKQKLFSVLLQQKGSNTVLKP
jgi:hypothetical protein